MSLAGVMPMDLETGGQPVRENVREAAVGSLYEEMMRTESAMGRRVLCLCVCMILMTLLVAHNRAQSSAWSGRSTTGGGSKGAAFSEGGQVLSSATSRNLLAKDSSGFFQEDRLIALTTETFSHDPNVSTEGLAGDVLHRSNLPVDSSSFKKIDWVLLGDSFAGQMAKGVLNDMAEKSQKSFLFGGAAYCAPFLDATSLNPNIRERNNYKQCKTAHRRTFLQNINSIETKVVFLVGNWHMYPQMWSSGNSFLGSTDFEVNLARLENTVQVVRNLGRKVVLIGQVPGAHYHPPNCMKSSGRLAFLKKCPTRSRIVEPLPGKFSETIKRRRAVRAAMNEAMKSSAVFKEGIANNWFAYVDPYLSLCDGKSCAVIVKGESLYNDEHHLTENATKLLTKDMTAAFESLHTD